MIGWEQPEEGDIIVWAAGTAEHIVFVDAWDGIYWDETEALRDTAGGLAHMDDAFVRPGFDAQPWPFNKEVE
jgi:hypothetical protein